MRRFAPLIVLAIAAIVVGLGWSYVSIKQRQSQDAPQQSPPLSNGLNAVAKGWEWSYTDAGRPVVEVRAKDMKSVKDPSVLELTQVEMKLFHKDGTVFDRVVSPKAQFATSDGKLYSDAEVGITMGLSSDDSPPGRLMTIKSSGVSFENKSGKADTDRHATFSLDVGEGEADGASYDPQIKELHLKSNVKLIWKGKDPKSPPMFIEAGELLYKELERKIYLSPWTKFSRNSLSMTGGPSVITLEEGNIRLVETVQSTGADKTSDRTVDFGADQLQLLFGDKAVMEKITGQNNARLTSTTATAKTTVTSQRLDLSFKPAEGGAELAQAVAMGSSTAESVPVPVPNKVTPETRVLKSEVLEMKMKEGGREIAQIDTHAPGVLEFLPNHPTQRKRRLDGERMTIRYGAANQLESFRSTKSKTRTEPAAQTAKKKAPPQLTSSDELAAEFDPKTGEMTKLEQWGSFRYEEADRRARADKAVLEQQKNVITLSGGARLWDAAGTTDADKIAIDQTAGATIAEGKVKTVREPEKAGDDKIRATADKMTTSANNTKIRYDGNAVLWQGENRLHAAEINIDRPSQQIGANGKVVNSLRDKNQPITTVVHAEHMTYSDKDKVAFYSGDVHMIRPQLDVKSQKLRAYLSQESPEETAATLPDSGLDRAFAEGSVEILQQDKDKTRFGTGDVADYYVADSKVILEGEKAQLTETQIGAKPTKTLGHKLTWFGVADKLLVDGAVEKPAISTLRRKNKG